MSEPLTATLQRTLDAVAAFETRCGYPPTARELGRVRGMDPTTATA